MNSTYLWSKILKKIRGSAIKSSTINKTSKVNSGSHVVNTTINRYSYCGYNCSIINCDIGAFCSIASDVSIGAAMHPMDWVSTSPVFQDCRSSPQKRFFRHSMPKPLRTIIKNDVWIGERVLIKQGVTIGNGAVIGMGSIVTKDVGDYWIVAGNPARIIRKRFSEETIKALLDSKWWNLPETALENLAKYTTDPLLFIEKLNPAQSNRTKEERQY